MSPTYCYVCHIQNQQISNILKCQFVPLLWSKLNTLVTWLVASLHSLHYDDDWKERSEYILHSNVQLKIILNCPQPNGLLLNTHSQKLVLDAAIEQHRNMPSWFKITDAPATGAICQLVFKAGAEITGVSVPAGHSENLSAACGYRCSCMSGCVLMADRCACVTGQCERNVFESFQTE